MKPLPKPSIVAVFEHYDATVLSGGPWQKATCVLHEDRNPSASLNDDECRWRCFSCGESGDAIDLIQKVENVGFARAKQLAEGFLTGSSGDVPPDSGFSSSLSGRPRRDKGSSRFVPAWRRI